jgi:putative transposase
MGETPRLQAKPLGGLRYDGEMAEYRKGSHSIYTLHYHFVFIPKYRKPVLRGDVGLRVRELVRRICQALDVEIIKGHVRPDHVHLLLSAPPTLSPSRLMQAIKGKTSIQLLRDFRVLRKEFWGRHLWARGYFVATSGNVTDEVISKYIESQDVEPQDDDGFKVTE